MPLRTQSSSLPWSERGAYHASLAATIDRLPWPEGGYTVGQLCRKLKADVYDVCEALEILRHMDSPAGSIGERAE